MAVQSRWYFYGTVYFTTTQRRTQTARRLDNYVTGGTWVASAWDLLVQAFGSWPSGYANVTGTADNGTSVPGLRFCYYTLSEAAARQAIDDVVASWQRFEDTDSNWSYTLVNVDVP
jgi:hypothetical protein